MNFVFVNKLLKIYNNGLKNNKTVIRSSIKLLQEYPIVNNTEMKKCLNMRYVKGGVDGCMMRGRRLRAVVTNCTLMERARSFAG